MPSIDGKAALDFGVMCQKGQPVLTPNLLCDQRFTSRGTEHFAPDSAAFLKTITFGSLV